MVLLQKCNDDQKEKVCWGLEIKESFTHRLGICYNATKNKRIIYTGVQTSGVASLYSEKLKIQ